MLHPTIWGQFNGFFLVPTFPTLALDQQGLSSFLQAFPLVNQVSHNQLKLIQVSPFEKSTLGAKPLPMLERWCEMINSIKSSILLNLDLI